MSFKGYAATTTPETPACGGTWTTGPGGSPNPPATVPDYIIVLVASSVTKSGSAISGDIIEMVIVRTDPGYGPDPGQTGTGTVTAVVCTVSGFGAAQPPLISMFDAWMASVNEMIGATKRWILGSS
jgi:hypothetical protein